LKPLALGLVLGVVAALVLQAVCRPALPAPSHAGLDSLDARHTRDSSLSAQAFTATAARADTLERRAGVPATTARRLRARADTIRLTDTLVLVAYDTLAAAFDSLTASDSLMRLSMRERVLGEGQRAMRIQQLEGEVNQRRGEEEDEREGWRRTLARAQRRRQWAAGLLADERLSPAGAWVSRDLGPLTLSLQVIRTDQTRAYLGAGIRF